MTPREALTTAEEEQDRFMREALLRYHQAEYRRAERRRLWKLIFWANVILIATIVGLLLQLG